MRKNWVENKIRKENKNWSRGTLLFIHTEKIETVPIAIMQKNVFTSTEYALCAVMARLEFMLKTHFEFVSIRLRVARCLAHLEVEIYVRPANLHAMRCSSEIWIFRRGLVQWDRRAYVCEMRERRSARRPRRRLRTNVYQHAQDTTMVQLLFFHSPAYV